MLRSFQVGDIGFCEWCVIAYRAICLPAFLAEFVHLLAQMIVVGLDDTLGLPLHDIPPFSRLRIDLAFRIAGVRHSPANRR